MAEFDLFQVKLDGIDDSGFVRSEVRMGFWDAESQQRQLIEVPAYLPADLDLTLREGREQAKDAALELLRKAVQLLEGHSSDQLHQVAQEQLAKQSAKIDNEARASIEVALQNASSDTPTNA